jgi:hypothetical protein
MVMAAALLLVALHVADGFMVGAGGPLHCRANVVMGGKGFGGGEATRDPAPTMYDPNDPKGKQQAIHKAESFSEYLAKRGAGGDAAPAPAGEETRDSAPVAAAAPAAAPAAFAAAAARISAAQQAAVERLVAANNMHASPPVDIGLASGVARVTPFIPEAPKQDSIQLGLEASRALATERQISAPKGEVSWCSSLDAGDFFSITAWNTPQVYVPHLYWSVGVVDGGYVTSDRAREHSTC